MTSQAKIPTKLSAVVSIDNKIDGLYAIRKPSVPAVIWRRKPVSKFQTWIDSLSDEQLPSARISLPLNAISEALTEVMQISGRQHAFNEKRQWTILQLWQMSLRRSIKRNFCD